MKRALITLAVLLVLCIMVSILASCGSQQTESSSKTTDSTTASSTEEISNFNETDFPIVNEKVVQKVAITINPSYTVDDISKMYFFEKMEAKTNVNFEFEKITTDQWKERKNLIFASNELPDIIIGSLSNSDISTYSNTGQLIALNDLIKSYAPDYYKCLGKFPESAKLYAPDGKMYGLCGTFTGGYAEVPGSRAFINVQWIENLGLKKPATWDEFYDVLVAFRDKDPDKNGKDDTIPLCGYSDGYAIDPFVAGPLGISFGWAKKNNWQVVGDKLVYVAEHPNYKLYLENMNKLYSEKLLDPEYYTQNDAQYVAKGSKMLIGACTCAAPFVVTGSTDPEIYKQYDVIGPLTSDVFTEKLWYGQNVGGMSIFLTSANKNPEISLRYFNEIYTEDGCWLLVGPEKGSWNGSPDGRVWNADKTQYSFEISSAYNGVYTWVNKNVAPINSGMAGYRQFSEAMKAEKMTLEDVALLESLKKNEVYMVPGSPSLFFTPEELEKINLIEASLYTYCGQMEAKIIMGEEPLSKYDTMIAELKKQGLDKLTEVYNTAYDRYKANME